MCTQSQSERGRIAWYAMGRSQNPRRVNESSSTSTQRRAEVDHPRERVGPHDFPIIYEWCRRVHVGPTRHCCEEHGYDSKRVQECCAESVHVPRVCRIGDSAQRSMREYLERTTHDAGLLTRDTSVDRDSVALRRHWRLGRVGGSAAGGPATQDPCGPRPRAARGYEADDEHVPWPGRRLEGSASGPRRWLERKDVRRRAEGVAAAGRAGDVGAPDDGTGGLSPGALPIPLPTTNRGANLAPRAVAAGRFRGPVLPFDGMPPEIG